MTFVVNETYPINNYNNIAYITQMKTPKHTVTKQYMIMIPRNVKSLNQCFRLISKSCYLSSEMH